MPALHPPLMVVSDLDGSLLDHHTYSWQPAADWLTRLQAQQIPLVICSSKTAAEIVPLQLQLGIGDTPFIAENGAVVRLPGHDWPQPVPYDRLIALLEPLQQQFRFRGFNRFTDAQIAEMTGLSEAQATLARQREASEVIIWQDAPHRLEEFHAVLARHALSLVQGGRFWHIVPADQGKGRALAWLLARWPAPEGAPMQTIGLGDGPDDAPMLDRVDLAVIIKGYSKFPVTLARTDQQHVYHSAHYGPQGWSEGLDYFLAHLKEE